MCTRPATVFYIFCVLLGQEKGQCDTNIVLGRSQESEIMHDHDVITFASQSTTIMQVPKQVPTICDVQDVTRR